MDVGPKTGDRMRLMILTTLLLVSLFAKAEESLKTAGDAPVVAAETANPVDSEAISAAVTAAEIGSADTGTKDEKAAESKAVKTANKKESEIPLTLDAPKKAEEDTHPIFKILLVVSMMGTVGVGAYLFLRKYSKTNYSLGKMNEIKVITQHHLGPKKSLAIIRVAGESILIGVTDQNINMIKSLSLLDDEVPEATPNHFSDVFTSNHSQEMQDTFEVSSRGQDEEDEFSIRGVKDAVSKKLKGMRSFQ